MSAPRLFPLASSANEPRSGQTAFVGRARELRDLSSALPGQSADFSTVRLISGDPGIGKSRLVAELAEQAVALGCTVVWGRCWDAESSPDYWPWTQVARELLGGERQTELGPLVLDDLAASDRFSLFDATAELVNDSTLDTPFLVILEDLHQADAGSLLLTRFIAQQISGNRLLIVGTFRPTDAAARPEINDQLTQLAELGAHTRLRPLSRDAVRSLFDNSGLADKVHAAAGGNPLFIEQLMRDHSLHENPANAPDHPPILIDTTIARLGQLSQATLGLLHALAILGSTPELSELSLLSGRGPTECLTLLQPAIDAGFITAIGGGDPGTGIEFTHHLMVEAALRTAAAEDLARLHGIRAQLLAEAPERQAERTHHLLSAGPAHLEAAVRASLAAAAASLSTLAFNDAARVSRRALDALSASGQEAPVLRIRLLISLAKGLSWGDDHVTAEQALDQAWELAQNSNDAEGMALVALGSRFRIDFAGEAVTLRAERCLAALAVAPPEPTVLRVRLLATLAAAQTVTDIPASRQTAADAVATARAVPDPVATGYALIASSVIDLTPATLEHRLTAARQILAIAEASGERDLVPTGYFLLLAALLESGDTRSLDSELAAHDSVSGQFAELASSRHSGWLRCTRAILDAQPELAEQLAKESFALAQAKNDPDAASVWGAQIAIIRWLQGRADEAEPIFLQARQAFPDEPIWTASLAWIWLFQGRRDAVRGLLEALPPLEEFPRDRNWLATVAILAEVAAEVGDSALVWQLRDTLLPYSQRLVSIGLGIACWGTVARPLGLLARRVGNTEEAIAHFESAIRVSSRVGAQAWLAEAQLELADALCSEHGRQAESSALVEEAALAAGRLGLGAIAARAAKLRHALLESNPGEAPPEAVAQDPLPLKARPRIDVLGAFEVASATGTVARWSSRKARELLKALVARRGTLITRETLMDLLWPGEAPDSLANRFSVAVTTVRRALDPERGFPSNHYISVVGESLRLRTDRITIDVESFLSLSAAAHETEDEDARALALRGALAAYRGDALADEPYAEWADALRAEARLAFCGAAHALGRLALGHGDALLAAETFRSILGLEEYDQAAHEGLIAALSELGAQGQAAEARKQLGERRAELELETRG